MNTIISFPQNKSSLLERFGLYYLKLFKRIDRDHSVFDLTDDELSKRVRRITNKGIILSSLIGIACVIAFPLAWFAMHNWLQSFSYRINIQWWMFAIAGILAALIAFFTIGLQAVRAAVANPVKSLRTE